MKILGLLIVLVWFCAGCTKTDDGIKIDTSEAKESVENTLNDAERGLKKGTAAVKDTLEDAGDAVKETYQDAKDKVQSATDTDKSSVEIEVKKD